MFTHNIHFKRSDANHSCHQRMLLQLCLVIRPLKFKIKHPHPEQLIKKMIVRGLKPSTAVIKGCYSNCARWSDPFQLNTPLPNLTFRSRSAPVLFPFSSRSALASFWILAEQEREIFSSSLVLVYTSIFRTFIFRQINYKMMGLAKRL